MKALKVQDTPKQPKFLLTENKWKIVCWMCKKSGKGITLKVVKQNGKKTDFYVCLEHDMIEVPMIGASSKVPIGYKTEVIKNDK